MLEILDSLIATVTVVLVLSLIVQAIQQIIKQLGSFKSTYMERELLAMFQQGTLPFVETDWKDKLLKRAPVSLQVQRLQSSKEGIAITNLIALLKSKLAAIGYDDFSLLETMKKEEVKNLLGLISSDLDQQLKSNATVNNLSSEVMEKMKGVLAVIETAKEDVENWYDLTLKAFQDHYERRMKMWSYVLSAVVVVGLNANLFDIYKEFSNNRALRESAIALGEKLTSMPRDSVIIRQSEGKSDTTVVAVSAEVIKKEIKKNMDDIRGLLEQESFQIMRWGKVADSSMSPHVRAQSWRELEWLWLGLGWLCMALLVGLGAPFWYDFLKTIMGIKNSLRGKPEKVKADGQNEEDQPQAVKGKKAGSKKK